MSKYYNPRRTRNVFDPNSDKPFKISRSKVDLFLNCPRCFYNDRRLGIGQPPGFPFNLNSAVDNLLKNEFDQFRALKKAHPLMLKNKIDGIPYAHEELDAWRDSLRRGIQYHHEESNLIFTGGVDDIWINPQKELIIVDYKATSKAEPVNLDAEWQIGYKRQMSFYAWLFKKNGFKVSPIGYFVYCNGIANRKAFNARLEFDISVLPYQIDDSWVPLTIPEIKQCLTAPLPPHPGEDCDFCAYYEARSESERHQLKLF